MKILFIRIGKRPETREEMHKRINKTILFLSMGCPEVHQAKVYTNQRN